MANQIEYDDHQLQAALSSSEKYLEDPTEGLKKSAGYMLKEIKKVFSEEGPGWDPREETTKKVVAERVKMRAHMTLRSKLKRDVKRAKKNVAKGSGKLTSLQRRKRVLKEFEELAETGGIKKSKLTEKQQLSLKTRLGRALQKSEQKSGKILGKLASSIFATISPDTLTLTSRPDWSSVHNDGGTAGHGAKIPKRTFMEWTPERLAKIGKIVVYGFQDAWNQGVGGNE